MGKKICKNMCKYYLKTENCYLSCGTKYPLPRILLLDATAWNNNILIFSPFFILINRLIYMFKREKLMD